jgi:hypothetical protein
VTSTKTRNESSTGTGTIDVRSTITPPPWPKESRQFSTAVVVGEVYFNGKTFSDIQITDIGGRLGSCQYLMDADQLLDYDGCTQAHRSALMTYLFGPRSYEPKAPNATLTTTCGGQITLVARHQTTKADMASILDRSAFKQIEYGTSKDNDVYWDPTPHTPPLKHTNSAYSPIGYFTRLREYPQKTDCPKFKSRLLEAKTMGKNEINCLWHLMESRPACYSIPGRRTMDFHRAQEGESKCVVDARTVEVFYSPVPRKSGFNMCGSPSVLVSSTKTPGMWKSFAHLGYLI